MRSTKSLRLMPSEIRLVRTLCPKLMIISITRKNAVTDLAGNAWVYKTTLLPDDAADDVTSRHTLADHISRANQRIRPMMLTSSPLPS